MRINEINAMRGPNYWSIWRHKLIVMKLDLEDLEEKPTNVIPGFGERLEKMFPTMFSHRCSETFEGGFFYRVKEGTWMGYVIEHIALEIQTLAGMDTGFGRTRTTGEKGKYHVVFSYMEEKVGIYAAKAAVRIAQALVNGEEYDLEDDLQNMRSIKNIFQTINTGVVEKGMPAWGKVMNPTDVRDVAFYVMSLQGTNPPDAKKAQGNPYTPEAPMAPADSTGGGK